MSGFQSKIPRLVVAEVEGGTSGMSEAPSSEVQVWRETNGEVAAYCHEESGNFWIRWVGVADYCFDSQIEIVKAFPEPNLDPFFIRDTYRRSILPVIQHLLGKESLHASAVLTPGGVVGLCGASMAGKSTVAYGLSRRGYTLWSDDALILEISSSSPEALPFPYRLHLRAPSARFFGLDPAAFTDLSDPIEACEGRAGNEALSTLFVLDQASEGRNRVRTAVTRLSPKQSLTALLPQAHCFSLKNEDRKRQMMHNFITLANCVPVFSVRFEPGLERLQEILDQIEHALRSSQAA